MCWTPLPVDSWSAFAGDPGASRQVVKATRAIALMGSILPAAGASPQIATLRSRRNH